jgi:hypothetical protein
VIWHGIDVKICVGNLARSLAIPGKGKLGFGYFIISRMPNFFFFIVDHFSSPRTPAIVSPYSITLLLQIDLFLFLIHFTST